MNSITKQKNKHLSFLFAAKFVIQISGEEEEEKKMII